MAIEDHWDDSIYSRCSSIKRVPLLAASVSILWPAVFSPVKGGPGCGRAGPRSSPPRGLNFLIALLDGLTANWAVPVFYASIWLSDWPVCSECCVWLTGSLGLNVVCDSDKLVWTEWSRVTLWPACVNWTLHVALWLVWTSYHSLTGLRELK